jgi:hypothetical protein
MILSPDTDPSTQVRLGAHARGNWPQTVEEDPWTDRSGTLRLSSGLPRFPSTLPRGTHYS